MECIDAYTLCIFGLSLNYFYIVRTKWLKAIIYDPSHNPHKFNRFYSEIFLHYLKVKGDGANQG